MAITLDSLLMTLRDEQTPAEALSPDLQVHDDDNST